MGSAPCGGGGGDAGWRMERPAALALYQITVALTLQLTWLEDFMDSDSDI